MSELRSAGESESEGETNLPRVFIPVKADDMSTYVTERLMPLEANQERISHDQS